MRKSKIIYGEIGDVLAKLRIELKLHKPEQTDEWIERTAKSIRCRELREHNQQTDWNVVHTSNGNAVCNNGYEIVIVKENGWVLMNDDVIDKKSALDVIQRLEKESFYGSRKELIEKIKKESLATNKNEYI